MKYQPGDILADFSKNEIFVFDGKNIEGRNIFKIRLLTPGERKIYETFFLNIGNLSFLEFKAKKPDFSTRHKLNVNFGHIAINENQFLFFRNLKSNVKHFRPESLEEKLTYLIFNYQEFIEHNSETRAKQNEKSKKIIQLFDQFKELLKD